MHWLLLKLTCYILVPCLCWLMNTLRKKGRKEKKSSVRKLASYSQSSPEFTVRKRKRIKIFKSFYETRYQIFTKLDKNNIKRPRGNPEPAMRVLQLVSSPFLFVYLAAQLRGGDPAAGEAGLSAMHSGKSSILVNMVHFTSNANIPLSSQFSPPLLRYISIGKSFTIVIMFQLQLQQVSVN